MKSCTILCLDGYAILTFAHIVNDVGKSKDGSAHNTAVFSYCTLTYLICDQKTGVLDHKNMIAKINRLCQVFL